MTRARCPWSLRGLTPAKRVSDPALRAIVTKSGSDPALRASQTPSGSESGTSPRPCRSSSISCCACSSRPRARRAPPRGTSTVTRTGERAVDESASVSSPSRASAVSSRYSSRPAGSFAPGDEPLVRLPQPLREHARVMARHEDGRLAAACRDRGRPHRIARLAPLVPQHGDDDGVRLTDRVALFHPAGYRRYRGSRARRAAARLGLDVGELLGVKSLRQRPTDGRALRANARRSGAGSDRAPERRGRPRRPAPRRAPRSEARSSARAPRRPRRRSGATPTLRAAPRSRCSNSSRRSGSTQNRACAPYARPRVVAAAAVGAQPAALEQRADDVAPVADHVHGESPADRRAARPRARTTSPASARRRGARARARAVRTRSRIVRSSLRGRPSG